MSQSWFAVRRARRWRACGWVAFFAILFVSGAPAHGATGFQGIGFAPGKSYSGANDISGDGKVVVGRLQPRTNYFVDKGGFRWTAEGGLQVLPMPTGRGTNYDGSVVVGQAYRWTASTGVVQLEGLDPNIDWGVDAIGVSDDGSVIVGRWDQATGFRWTGPAGPAELLYPMQSINSVSGDGATWIGTSRDSKAVRWNEAQGFATLGALPNEYINAPTSQSRDGSIIVGGVLFNDYSYAAWRWTEATGMVEIPSPQDYTMGSYLVDVSADGRIAVGTGFLAAGQTTGATVWNPDVGMLDLQAWLQANGMQGLANWHLVEANATSADGRSIVGTGTNPAGLTEGWIVRLPALGDANGDDLVDAADYTLWADNFLASTNLYARGDFNWDGRVDAADYTLWGDNFDPQTHVSLVAHAVPEPKSILLLVIGMALLVRRANANRFSPHRPAPRSARA